MRLTKYSLSRDSFFMIKNILFDTIRIRFRGVPKINGKDLNEIARFILKKNLNDGILFSGFGHYKLMWVADLGMAFRGLYLVAGKEQIKLVLERILNTVSKHKKAFSCYRFNRGSDIPFERVDSLPWIIYCLYEHGTLSGDNGLLRKYKPQLQILLEKFERDYLDKNGMVKRSATGDWMDTVKRPSSTWNNLCVLKMLTLAKKMRFQVKTEIKTLEKKLLADRFKNNNLVDYHGTSQPGIDGMILAVYFELFNKAIRHKISDSLEKMNIFHPYPVRASIAKYPSSFIPIVTTLTAHGFHEKAHWPHLGLMFLNGLSKINRRSDRHFENLVTLFTKYGNFLETVSGKGTVLKTFLSTEYGFSMTAGQFLEYTH